MVKDEGVTLTTSFEQYSPKENDRHTNVRVIVCFGVMLCETVFNAMINLMEA